MKKNAVFPMALVLLTVLISELHAQLETRTVKSFEKVIVSPHIQVVFEEGEVEQVSIEDADIPLEKLKVEVNGKTLRIYLEDAKFLTKRVKYKAPYGKNKRPMYQGTEARVVVHYKNLKRLAVRGEQQITLNSPIERHKFRLLLYGESKVIFNKIAVNKLRTTIYGESEVEVKSGTIEKQKYLAYGESRVNTLGALNGTTRITAYGESDFKVNVRDKIKLSAFGEALVRYEGDPNINRGIVIGRARIKRL
ncbi:MAG: head GIN domain-containing protein [Bacteroidota bacterium]